MGKLKQVELEIYIRVPSLNGSYSCGKVYKCKHTKKMKASFYMNEKGVSFKRAMRQLIRGLHKEEALKSDVKVWLEYWYKGDYGRDVDSGIKITLDSMNGLVFDDDYQIKKLVVTKYEPAKVNKVKITMKELSEKEKAFIEEKKGEM